MFGLLINGILIGLCVSIPVGPVGVIGIQRTIRDGWKHGACTAIGSITSDLFYALIAGYSLTFVVDFLQKYQTQIQIFGVIFIILFGIKTFLSNPARQLNNEKIGKKMNYLQNIISSFFLTFINPLIIFLFIAFFAQHEFITSDNTFIDVVLGYLGILIGALFWWILIIGTVNMFRNRFNVRGLRLINRLAGSFIILIAIGSIIWGIVK